MNTPVRVRTGIGKSELFDFRDPNWDLLTTQMVAGALSKLARFNGHMANDGDEDVGIFTGTSFYSVAQHAVHCASVAFRIGYPPAIVRACMHHDDVESVTGDVVSPFKNFIPQLATVCAELDRSYACHTGLSLHHKNVKHVDQIMYAYEASEFFPDDDPLSDDQETLLEQCYSVLDTLIPWDHDIAYRTYIMVSDTCDVGDVYAIPTHITAANSEQLQRNLCE